jgi:hypothetical protein
MGLTRRNGILSINHDQHRRLRKTTAAARFAAE